MQISLSKIRQAIAHEDGECLAVGNGCSCPTIPRAISAAYRSPGGRRLLGAAAGNRERFAWEESVIRDAATLPPRGGYQPPVNRGGMTATEESELKYACLHESGHVCICFDRGVAVSKAVVNANGSGHILYSKRCSGLDVVRICLGGMAAIYGNTSLSTLYEERELNGTSSDFASLLPTLRWNANVAQAKMRGLPMRTAVRLDCDYPDWQLVENAEDELDYVRELLAEHDGFVLRCAEELFERRELDGDELLNLWSRHVAGRL